MKILIILALAALVTACGKDTETVMLTNSRGDTVTITSQVSASRAEEPKRTARDPKQIESMNSDYENIRRDQQERFERDCAELREKPESLERFEKGIRERFAKLQPEPDHPKLIDFAITTRKELMEDCPSGKNRHALKALRLH